MTVSTAYLKRTLKDMENKVSDQHAINKKNFIEIVKELIRRRKDEK